MTKVTFDISLSLDGFMTAANVRPEMVARRQGRAAGRGQARVHVMGRGLASGSPLFGGRVDLGLVDSVFATGGLALTYKAAGGDE